MRVYFIILIITFVLVWAMGMTGKREVSSIAKKGDLSSIELVELTFNHYKTL